MRNTELPIIMVNLCTRTDISAADIVSTARTFEREPVPGLDNKRVHLTEAAPASTEVVYSNGGFELPEPDHHSMIRVEADADGDLHVHTASDRETLETVLSHHQRALSDVSTVSVQNLTFYLEFTDTSRFDTQIQQSEQNVASVMYEFDEETVTLTQRPGSIRYSHSSSVGDIPPGEISNVVEAQLTAVEQRLSEFRQ